ncbi:MAG: methylmalonyl Co-A mutase-associated GTPase MeaB, partial [Gammaproteobacteria bacterium]|nr:methylmalonyl Co-A mutase-associated GTPase MeaB [Gammaproteobacteria bacterium]
VIIIETVGVGQSETAVAEMTDIFLLLLLPGGGDELQGIKRGIVELADVIVVNKADGDLESVAQRSARDYQSALGFLHPRHQDWKVPVETCSALNHEGIDKIWNTICSYRKTMTDNGELKTTRARQAKEWMWNEISATLLEALQRDESIKLQVATLEQQVATGKTSPWIAAQKLVGIFSKTNTD